MNKKFGVLAVSTLMLAMPFISLADTLTRQLEMGSRGADVSALQTFLATDVTLYPQGLVTGYFGFLTKSAVANFQTRNGIASVGRVGPQTLPVLNAQMAGGMSGNNGAAPAITDVQANRNNTSATISWNTNEPARAVVYYSTSPLTMYERTNAVDVSGNTASTNTNYNTSHNVALANLQSNTVYYYLVYTTDQDGNVSVTWPATFQTTN